MSIITVDIDIRLGFFMFSGMEFLNHKAVISFFFIYNKVINFGGNSLSRKKIKDISQELIFVDHNKSNNLRQFIFVDRPF